MNAHPSNFYVAHRLFSGLRNHPGPVWGAMTDGPEDRGEVVDRICEWAADSDDADKPSLSTLRVWWFQDDVPVRDVTEDVLAEAFAQRWAA
jgi:hypothetical protein